MIYLFFLVSLFPFSCFSRFLGLVAFVFLLGEDTSVRQRRENGGETREISSGPFFLIFSFSFSSFCHTPCLEELPDFSRDGFSFFLSLCLFLFLFASYSILGRERACGFSSVVLGHRFRVPLFAPLFLGRPRHLHTRERPAQR